VQLTKQTVEEIKAENFESREFFHKAKASIQRSNFERAASLLKEALKIAPGNPNYLSHMGLCMGMTGNLREGEIMCRKAVTLDPLRPILLVNLGRVLLEQGKREEARKAFTRAYEIDDTNAAAALELSRMGVRRKPVIRFLPRSHPLNVCLGKIRHRVLVRLKEPKWKKL
jgi:Flp pilus assembly protein TadD